MYPIKNNFWVAYAIHKFVPTLVDTKEDSQHRQRNSALNYVKRWDTCIDIGSQFGICLLYTSQSPRD